MNFLASPLVQFCQSLGHVGVLLLTTLKDLLDNLVTLRLGLQDLSRVSISLSLELVGGYLIVALGQGLHLLCLVECLCLVQLCVEHFDLTLVQIVPCLVVLILLVIDVVANVVDLPLSLLNCGIKLHGVLGGVPQSLLQVCDLSRQFTLGCYIKRIKI